MVDMGPVERRVLWAPINGSEVVLPILGGKATPDLLSWVGLVVGHLVGDHVLNQREHPFWRRVFKTRRTRTSGCGRPIWTVEVVVVEATQKTVEVGEYFSGDRCNPRHPHEGFKPLVWD